MKNFILKTITWIMGIVWCICLCAVNTERPVVFLLIFGISSAWLVFFMWANDFIAKDGEENAVDR